MPLAEKSRVRYQMRYLNFINLPNPSGLTRRWDLTNLQEKLMSETEIKKHLWSRTRPVHDAYNLTAICEPIVCTMWDPQHLTTVQAFMACYGNSFTFYF
jgi:hypothetical protein